MQSENSQKIYFLLEAQEHKNEVFYLLINDLQGSNYF